MVRFHRERGVSIASGATVRVDLNVTAMLNPDQFRHSRAFGEWQETIDGEIADCKLPDGQLYVEGGPAGVWPRRTVMVRNTGPAFSGTLSVEIP